MNEEEMVFSVSKCEDYGFNTGNGGYLLYELDCLPSFEGYDKLYIRVYKPVSISSWSTSERGTVSGSVSTDTVSGSEKLEVFTERGNYARVSNKIAEESDNSIYKFARKHGRKVRGRMYH